MNQAVIKKNHILSFNGLFEGKRNRALLVCQVPPGLAEPTRSLINKSLIVGLLINTCL